MFTILGADGKEYGPVTAETVRQWIAAGRANAQTQARREGETVWKTLGEFPEFASPPPAPPLRVPVEGAPVAPTPITGDLATIAADFSARAAKIDVFGCLGRSFNLWKSHFLPLVGVTLLILFVQIIIGLIPILGAISGLFLNGVFCGGLYYYYLGKMRGEAREVSDAFAGFSKAFVPLMLATLLSAVVTIAVMLLFCAPLFSFVIKTALHGGGGAPHLGPLSLVGLFVGVIIVFYLSVSWSLTFPLVIDKGLGPWTAMEVSRRVVAKQWFRMFFVMLLGGILTMLGIIGLFIGVLFTLPLVFGAILYAYEDLFHQPAARQG